MNTVDSNDGPKPALLFLHAHPDDEAMLTGATLAKAAALGLRTIVVYGTSGDAGEVRIDLGGEPLGARRTREARAACAELGVGRVEWLGYADSGMAGTATNARHDAFGAAQVTEAVDRLVALLHDERIGAVFGYDANGTYGHPDHRQVHAVAHAFASATGCPWLFDATWDRDYLAGLGSETPDPSFASGRAELTHFVQGEQWFRAKMEAIKRHESQAPPERQRGAGGGIERWRTRFGTEWFIAHPSPGTVDLAALGSLLEPEAAWPGPLQRSDASAG